MSPSDAGMAEVVETTQRTVPVVQVEESPQVAEVTEAAGSEEPTLIRGLMQRVEAFAGVNKKSLLRALRLQCEEMSFKRC